MNKKYASIASFILALIPQFFAWGWPMLPEPVQILFRVISVISLLVLIVLIVLIIIERKQKILNKDSNLQLEPELIIGAKVVDNPFLGITERMSVSLPIPTDTLKTVEIGLKLSKPIVINKLYLEIWGKQIEPLEFPHLKKFIDNELIEHSDIFKTGFSIPQIYAIDDLTAKICIFANSIPYWSNPFTITFGATK